MTGYPAPTLPQKYGADMANLLNRVATLEHQMAQQTSGPFATRIAKRQLAGPVSSVTFSGIPQTFTDLQLRISAKSDGTGASGFDSANMQFNGIATATYNWSTIWVVQGGAVSTTGGTAQTSMQCMEVWNSHFASAGRGIATIEIPNYADANNTKQFTSSSTATDSGAAGILQIYAGAGASAAAITSITLLMGVGNFIADSTFTLYGM